MLDLLDLSEMEPAPTGWRRVPRYPTFSYKVHIASKVWTALERKDWRALRALNVVWYDEYAHKWFPFTRHFFEHIDYVLVYAGD